MDNYVDLVTDKTPDTPHYFLCFAESTEVSKNQEKILLPAEIQGVQVAPVRQAVEQRLTQQLTSCFFRNADHCLSGSIGLDL